MQRDGTTRLTVAHDDVDNQQVADPANAARTVQPGPQCPGYGRTGREEIHIAAAWPVMPWCLRLLDVPILARPPDLPGNHLATTPRAVLAQQRGEAFVAEASARGERVGQMMLPMIGHLLAARGCHCHLRHYRRTAAPDQASIHQDHICACARRLERGIHARAACTDDENVRVELRDLPLHNAIFP